MLVKSGQRCFLCFLMVGIIISQFLSSPSPYSHRHVISKLIKSCMLVYRVLYLCTFLVACQTHCYVVALLNGGRAWRYRPICARSNAKFVDAGSAKLLDLLGDGGDPVAVEKYWAQRYRLFSRFDWGIQIDAGKSSFAHFHAYVPFQNIFPRKFASLNLVIVTALTSAHI